MGTCTLHPEKASYPTKRSAEDRLVEIRKMPEFSEKTPSRAYQCPGCDKWHLTSQGERLRAHADVPAGPVQTVTTPGWVVAEPKASAASSEAKVTSVEPPPPAGTEQWEAYRRPIGFVTPTMTEREYGAIPAVRSSLIRALSDGTPRDVRWTLGGGRKSESADMRLGTLLHAMFLLPDWRRDIFVMPAEFKDFRKDDAKALRSQAEAAGRLAVLAPEVAEACRIAEVVMDTPEARELLECPGANELAIGWNHPGTGLACKARLDRWCGVVSPDLKTTGRRIDEEAFARHAFDMGYHLSAVHYVEGVHKALGEHTEFKIIAVRNEEPYDCAVHRLSEELMLLGWRHRERLMARLADCFATDKWPGTPGGTLRAPKWHREAA